MNAIAIKRDLEGIKRGMRGEIIQQYAMQYGVSQDTVYRVLRKEFGPTKKITGRPKISDDLVDAIGKMKLKGQKLGLSEREISTEICIEMLQNNGVNGAENLTVSTINRRLKENGFRQRDTIVRVEAEYANQQHQLDFSRSKYFNLHKRTEDGDFILRVSKVLSYKQDGARLRLWMAGIVDSFSRLGVMQAYPATGESTVLGLNIMRFAYNREEDQLPFRHLPEVLKMDNGPVDNKEVDHLLKKLEIEKELVIPYKKRGIQKQESVWKLVWRRFELPLALKLGDGGTMLLSDYNYMLHEFMISNCTVQHPVRNGSKEHNYRSSLTAHSPRIIEDDLSEILFKTWKRKVRQDLTVSLTYKGEKLKLEAPRFAIDQWIEVYMNYAGDFVGELSDEYHKPFPMKTTEGFVNIGNFEHRQHATYKDGLELEIKEEVRSKKLEAKINYIQPKEEIIKPETKFTEAEIDENYIFPSVHEAKVYIGKMLNRDENYSTVADIFDELWSEEDILVKKNIDIILLKIRNQKAWG